MSRISDTIHVVNYYVFTMLFHMASFDDVVDERRFDRLRNAVCSLLSLGMFSIEFINEELDTSLSSQLISSSVTLGNVAIVSTFSSVTDGVLDVLLLQSDSGTSFSLNFFRSSSKLLSSVCFSSDGYSYIVLFWL